MTTTMKYRSHPCINVKKQKCNSSLCSSFSQIERDQITKVINNLKINKTTQNT